MPVAWVLPHATGRLLQTVETVAGLDRREAPAVKSQSDVRMADRGIASTASPTVRRTRWTRVDCDRPFDSPGHVDSAFSRRTIASTLASRGRASGAARSQAEPGNEGYEASGTNPPRPKPAHNATIAARNSSTGERDTNRVCPRVPRTGPAVDSADAVAVSIIVRLFETRQSFSRATFPDPRAALAITAVHIATKKTFRCALFRDGFFEPDASFNSTSLAIPRVAWISVHAERDCSHHRSA